MKNALILIAITLLCLNSTSAVAQGTFTSNVTDRGNWNVSGSWTLTSGSDVDGIPDSDDDVTIINGDTIDLVSDEEVSTLTIDAGGVLMHSNNDQISVYGNYTNNGVQDGGNNGSDLLFITAGSVLDGSGIISNDGDIHINANLTIATTANLNIESGTETAFNGAHTVTNNGTIDINDDLTGFAGCTWTQGLNSVLKFGNNSIPVTDGTLDCSTNANTFFYDKGNTHDSILPIDYHHLTIDISNTNRAANAKNDFTVNGNLTINSGRIMTNSGVTLTVSGTTTINTGGTLGFNNDATGINNLQAITLNGGQLGRSQNGTVNCTSITCNASTSSTLNRCTLNASGNVTVNGDLNSNSNNGVKTISGDLTISATGSWSSTSNESFTITGDFTNNGTFSTGTGDYTFTGTSKSFNDASGLLTFGDNITIDGTYTNNVTSLVFSGNLAGTGSLTNSTNTSLSIGGNATITTLDASAVPNTVIYNGTGNQGAAEIDYYNLTISNTGTSPNNEVTLASGTNIDVENLINITAGTLEYSGAVQHLSGNADVTMAAGTNFRIRTRNSSGTVPGLTGTYTLDPTSTFTFWRNGDQSISNAFTYQNLTFEGSGSKDLTGNIIVEGNLNIDETAILDVTASNFSITLAGNWTSTSTDADAFLQQAGTVTLNGTGTQTISSATIGGETFNNLIVSKTAGGVTLTDSVTIETFLTLTQGIVSSSSTALVTFNDGSDSNGGDADSFIDGPVKKIGDDVFTFPLGDGTSWARAAISNPTETTEEFTAEYFANGQGDLSVTGGLNNASTREYWNIDRGVSTTSNVSVTLHFENTTFSDITALTTDLVIARYDGTDWTSEGQSALPVTSLTSSGAVTSFGSFTFGSLSSAVNPLPIELINFDAIEENKSVKLVWSTSSEINNDYFTIEKSQDGESFETLTTIEGAGNSNQELSYLTFDHNPFSGTSYYRLKQTDFDGKHEYFKIIPISIDNSEMNSYPNPISSMFTLELENISENAAIRITDISGKTVFSRDNLSQNAITIISEKWNSGVYMVTLINDHNTKTIRIIK